MRRYSTVQKKKRHFRNGCIDKFVLIYFHGKGLLLIYTLNCGDYIYSVFSSSAPYVLYRVVKIGFKCFG